MSVPVDGLGEPLPRGPADAYTSTLPVTHTSNCWRWHHPCAVARIKVLRAALGEAVAVFDRAVEQGGVEHFAARLITAEQFDRWQRALTDVAGADVTPDPAAPATTT